MQERRRLSRDRDERMLGGVCAGIAKHYDYDVTVVRIVFVLLALLSGFGVIAYLVMWLLLPAGPRSEAPRRQMMRDNVEEMTERARLAAESARAAADAARLAADQLAEATRSAVNAARDTWQQGSQQQGSQAQGAQQAGGEAASEAGDIEPEASGKPGETTPDGSQSTWPPDRELPATEAQAEDEASTARSEPRSVEMEPEPSEKPGETTPEGSESTWPPDRELPATEEQPDDRPPTSGPTGGTGGAGGTGTSL